MSGIAVQKMCKNKGRETSVSNDLHLENKWKINRNCNERDSWRDDRRWRSSLCENQQFERVRNERVRNSQDLFRSAVKVCQYVNYFIYHLLVVPQTIPTELVYI